MYSLSQQYNNWNIGQNWLVVDQFVLTTVQVDIVPLIGLCTPSCTAGGDLSEWLRYAKVHPYVYPSPICLLTVCFLFMLIIYTLQVLFECLECVSKPLQPVVNCFSIFSSICFMLIFVLGISLLHFRLNHSCHSWRHVTWVGCTNDFAIAKYWIRLAAVLSRDVWGVSIILRLRRSQLVLA